MSNYTKLFHSINTSTIWRAPNPTRILWITMLTLTTKSGTVEGSVPGLADIARITLDECVAALAELSAPDEWSRTTAHEGRRIEAIPGGWAILNFEDYRNRTGVEDVREYNRIKQSEYRKRKASKVSPQVEDNVSGDPIQIQIADTKVRTEVPSPSAPDPAAFSAFWSAYPKKVGKAAALKVWKRLRPSESLGVAIVAAVATARQSRQWVEGYIPHPSRWLNEERWQDEVDISTPPKPRADYRHDWQKEEGQ
jgi:hypothetical protein|tara:strand:- start:46 stop:801 length:756 start_codon:yes stop_codon:yes gene_type:complete